MRLVTTAFCVSAVLGFAVFNFAVTKLENPTAHAQELQAADSPSPTPMQSSVPATPTPTASPSPTPTVKPTVTPKPTPKETPIPQPDFTPSEINALIERFSAQYSVDPNVVRHIALCESGLNPKAVNGPYAGLFQFGKVTWNTYRRAIGEDSSADLRLNAEEAIQTAAYAMSQRKFHIWPNCHP